MDSSPLIILPGRLVLARYVAKTERQALRTVDDDNCQGQVNQLVFTETAASLLANIIRYMSLQNERTERSAR
jgi:hypothetical protein